MGTSSTAAIEIEIGDQEEINSLKPDNSLELATSLAVEELSSNTTWSFIQPHSARYWKRLDKFASDHNEDQKEDFEILGHWEGMVTIVEQRSFFAAMRSRDSEQELPDEQFEIDLDNVDEGDRELVREGAVFYLTVGIRRARGEGPAKTTRVVFRRMPRWSSRDIERAESEAEKLWLALNQDISNGGALSPSDVK